MKLLESKIKFCPFCGNKLVPYYEPRTDMRWIGLDNRKFEKIMYSMWDCESCDIVFEIIEKNFRIFTHICPTFWKDSFEINIRAKDKKEKTHSP